MLASSFLVLFRRNQVAVLVASSYFICREIVEKKKYALDLGRETRVLLITGRGGMDEMCQQFNPCSI